MPAATPSALTFEGVGERVYFGVSLTALIAGVILAIVGLVRWW